MWIKKLKKKKMQYAVICLILACITSIFTGCLSFVLGIREFTDSYYSKEVMPEFFFALEGEAGKEALEELEKEDVFEELYLQEGKDLNEKVEINGKHISLVQATLLGIRDIKDFPFDFHANGDIAKLKAPEPGTVWVSSILAELREVEVGDELTLQGRQKHTFKIAGTYNTAICPAASMGFYPFYVNEAELLGMGDMETGYFGCFSRNDLETPLTEFVEELPKVFLESLHMQYDLKGLKLSLETGVMILAGVGMAASFLIFLVSIIIIRFIIKSNLIKEYKSIGIYKALGFQSREIIGFYLKCYMMTGVIGISLGALLGLPMAHYMGTISTQYLGTYRTSGAAFAVTFVVIAILLLILLLNLFFALGKIKNINPVKALNMEMNSSKAKLRKSLIRNAHSPFSMAVNNIFKRKGNSFMTMLILTVAFYLSIFFLMVNYTGRHMSEETADWFGIPNTGCFVNAALDESAEKKIERSPYVDKVSYGQLYQIMSIESPDIEADWTNCVVFSYSDFSEDLTGIEYVPGRAPRGANEIAMATKMLESANVKVGDYVRLNFNDVEREYLITGQYNSMMNGGRSIQVPNVALDASNAAYSNNIAFVKLKDSSDYTAFKDEIESTIEKADVSDTLEAVEDSTKGVTDMLVPITSIMVVIFISFGFLNIINLMVMNHIDNRKNFGILKALGFTNRYIMMQNIFKILLLSLVSIFIALILHFSMSARLFRMMVSVDGLVDHIPTMMGLVGTMLLLIVLASVLFTIPLRRITPADLMEE